MTKNIKIVKRSGTPANRPGKRIESSNIAWYASTLILSCSICQDIAPNGLRGKGFLTDVEAKH